MKNEFEIRGDKAVIFLRKKDESRREAIINIGDLERAREIHYTWNAIWNKDTESYYVVTDMKKNGKWTTERLHRWLMTPLPDQDVDHQDHDTLNNTRSNMKNVSRSENAQNRKGPNKGNASGYRGVSWNKCNRAWRARLMVNGRPVHLGCYATAEEANFATIAGREKYMTNAGKILKKEV